MAKKNLVPRPTVRTIDELAYVNDDSLWEMKSIAEDYLDKARQVSHSNVQRLWEEEICYIDREIQIRQSREASHEDFKQAVAAGLVFDNIEDLYKQLDNE